MEIKRKPKREKKEYNKELHHKNNGILHIQLQKKQRNHMEIN